MKKLILVSVLFLTASSAFTQSQFPVFPVWNIAGFLGSTLWLVWLILIGIGFIRR